VIKQRHAPFYRIQQLQTALLDLLFPPQCVACRAYGARLCAACAQLVEPVGSQICQCCGRPQASSVPQCSQCQQRRSPAPAIIRIAALHTTPLRQAIHALKYENRPELAEPLARYLIALVQPSFPWQKVLPTIDAVIPVPLHTERYRARGYNQAELLASAFCRSVQYPLRSAWLVRQRSTQSQVGLTAAERQQNVQDAFVASNAVAGKCILLIDDVHTTGATMQACAQAAIHAGATAIFGLALACPK